MRNSVSMLLAFLLFTATLAGCLGGNEASESSEPYMLTNAVGLDNNYHPENLMPVGNTLYFSANDLTDGSYGTELWKSDGTVSGTVMVKDIYNGRDSSESSQLTAVGNTLYFRADNGINGFELWKSDGTASGTVMVKDIGGGISSYPSLLTAVGNTFYFQTDDGTNGRELWKSDGTASGTVMVKDINSGSGSSSPLYFTAIGNTLFFRADDGTNGDELWMYGLF